MARRDSPLAAIIKKRCRELGLSRSDLISRCDYKNIAKGLRRLDAAFAGDFNEKDSDESIDSDDLDWD